ncbi:hypothetical protein [Spiroplasma endosymbiont of Lariophagus distinguendus]|uniref:hypothetical protein n=1 Tax=Spiroplasma endosymbiont of Lariophagus distinguendus TaxID=2935082 RepID=UPI002079EB3C|nr:hypothetical protein [Spiroplasma endosymbiont of Lariophagus distinguendus]
MQLTSKEQEILSTYQNWLKKNNLSGNCNAYFISKTSMLVFQVWEFEKLISETLWLKTGNQEWKFYIKTLGEKFNKYFSLNEILEIEKKLF